MLCVLERSRKRPRSSKASSDQRLYPVFKLIHIVHHILLSIFRQLPTHLAMVGAPCNINIEQTVEARALQMVCPQICIPMELT